MKIEKPCDDWQNLMVDAFGGELEASLGGPFQSHVEQCAQCGPIWRGYQEVRQASRAGEETLSPHLQSSERILQFAQAKIPARKLKTEARRAPSRWTWLFGPSAVAFATLCLAVGFGLLSHRLKPVENRTIPATQGVPRQDLEAPASSDKASENKNDAFERELKPLPKRATGAGDKAVEATRLRTSPAPQKTLTPPASPEVFLKDEPAPRAPRHEAAGALSAPPEATEATDGKGKQESAEFGSEAPAPAAKPTPAAVKEIRDSLSVTGEAPLEEKLRGPQDPDDSKTLKKKPAAPDRAPEGQSALNQADETPNLESLLASARSKIEAGRCEAALVDLKQAESLGKNSEVEKLIRQCEEKSEATTQKARVK